MTARIRDQTGMSAVEFVLIVPVLVVALLFTVGLARIAHARHQVESLAADAARAASLERDTGLAAAAGRQMALRSMGAAGLSCADLRVSVDVSGYQPGGVVQARVTCRAALSDVAMAGLPGSRAFTAQATVPIETYRSS
jgi:Flp pilus assembly protein TadG